MKWTYIWFIHVHLINCWFIHVHVTVCSFMCILNMTFWIIIGSFMFIMNTYNHLVRHDEDHLVRHDEDHLVWHDEDHKHVHSCSVIVLCFIMFIKQMNIYVYSLLNVVKNALIAHVHDATIWIHTLIWY